MLISCPECSGKLSSVAPTCPHCGYAQSAPKAAPSPPAAAAGPPPEPIPELVLPSDKTLRKASRLQWSEWVHSSVWRMFFGAVILLVTLGLLVLAILLANRMNDTRIQEMPLQKAIGR